MIVKCQARRPSRAYETDHEPQAGQEEAEGEGLQHPSAADPARQPRAYLRADHYPDAHRDGAADAGLDARRRCGSGSYPVLCTPWLGIHD